MQLALETWPLSRLVAYARNPRKNDHVVDKICASITEFGFAVPVLAKSDGTVIDGHLRLKGANKLGLSEIPVLVCDGWSDARVRAFRLLANRSVSWADWDNELLSLELHDLNLTDFDLSLTGFDLDEIQALLTFQHGTEGLTDEDAVPETPAISVTHLGDLWVLGNHRLLCGDSTNADTVAKVLNEVSPHLMVTDPPYGVEYDADWRNKSLRSDGSASDGRAIGKVLNDAREDWTDAWALFPGEVAYVWHGERQLLSMGEQLKRNDFEPRNLIVWAKHQFVIGRGHYHSQHETCWYAVKKSGSGHWTGDRKQTTVWHIGKPQKSETGHSTQKPVECMLRPMENNSSPGQAVYEPFSGSGTTIIAGEKSGRCVCAIELNPAYVDVTLQRWADFTGRDPVRDDGKKWSELKPAAPVEDKKSTKAVGTNATPKSKQKVQGKRK